jgi:hypothetical protein
VPTVLLQHSIVGRSELTNFEFDSDKPFRACLICGAIYQSVMDRLPLNSYEVALATVDRQVWADSHARRHTSKQHNELRRSGRFCTPEAAQVLAPLGIAPVSDMVMSDEHAHAISTAPRAPLSDALPS